MQDPLEPESNKPQLHESRLHPCDLEANDDIVGGGIMLVAMFFMVLCGYLTSFGVFVFGKDVHWWIIALSFMLVAMLGGTSFYSLRYLTKKSRAGKDIGYRENNHGGSRKIHSSVSRHFSKWEPSASAIWPSVAILGLLIGWAMGAIDVNVPSFLNSLVFLSFEPATTVMLSAILILLIGAGIVGFIDLFGVAFDSDRMNEERPIARPNVNGKMNNNETISLNLRVLGVQHAKECRTVQWLQFHGSKRAETEPRVFCIGSTDPSARMSSLGPQIKWACDSSVDLCNDLVSSLEAVKVSPSAWKLIIIDVDHAERNMDLDEIVKQLLEFRVDCASVPLILLSNGFASNDSSLVRSAIADYSFRSSVSDLNIIATLPEVYENHKIWQGRSKEYADFHNNVLPFDKRIE
jgi:hypothetical protein